MSERNARIIWKYEIAGLGGDIELPIYAEILDIQIQDGRLAFWAIIDPKETKKELRSFRCFLTGVPTKELSQYQRDRLCYLGSDESPILSESSVFHIFEEI